MNTPPPDPSEGLSSADSAERATGPQVHQEGTVSGRGQLNQAGRDLNINKSTVLPAGAIRPVTEVTAAPGLANVPGHRQVFVGRGDELEELDAALRAPGGVVVAAVHGLGGVGKSTLAARYAATHAARAAHTARVATGEGTGLDEAVFNPVWWITADTAPAVQAGLAGLATALQPELKTVLELEALAERGLAWLGCHSDWLVVLDNVNDPAHIAPLLDRTTPLPPKPSPSTAWSRPLPAPRTLTA
ncbi:AAA family ATPase [Actinomadura sp. WMMA1423]|uniref:AAA family ATPase n=1 Tax=Actinomadura sp. WMMA1423 TaxID=2591108 RepID=UPI0011461EAE|nr:AAA family ATPase [Actinomadura sp. WMMA1423]